MNQNNIQSYLHSVYCVQTLHCSLLSLVHLTLHNAIVNQCNIDLMQKLYLHYASLTRSRGKTGFQIIGY